MKPLLALVTLFAFFTAYAETADIGTYDAYHESVDKYCNADKVQSDGKTVSIPWNGPSFKDPLLTISSIYYPDITNPDSDKKFQELMSSIKGNPDELNGLLALQSQYAPLASQVEKASAIYKERMNSIYGCAILNSKLRIHTKLIETFRPSGSNIISKLEQNSEQIRQRMKEMQCRIVTYSAPKEQDGGGDDQQGKELSLKGQVIAQTTREYCNYRHYLYYVDYSLKHRLGDVLSAEKKQRATQAAGMQDDARFLNTDALASSLADVASRADSEIARTKGVYGEAFDAYADFERNYWEHVLMILIEDRYAALRDSLREVMNPIGQVIYLASNATGTGK